MLHREKPSQAGEECAARRNSDAQYGAQTGEKHSTAQDEGEKNSMAQDQGEKHSMAQDEGERSNRWNSLSAKLCSPLLHVFAL